MSADLNLFYRAALKPPDFCCDVEVWEEDIRGHHTLFVRHHYRDGGDCVYSFEVRERVIFFLGYGRGEFYKTGLY